MSFTRIAALPQLAALAAAFALAGPAAGADSDLDRLEKRAAKLVDAVESVQLADSSRIPPSVLRNAKGVIVLRQFEAGFVFGGKGGYGVAIERDASGDWGLPAWIKTGEGSWGLQAGAQTLRVVLVIMNDDGMRMLRKPKFRIGVDASVTAGPTGRNVEAKIGADTAILAYADTVGLYAGATFEGGFLIPDKKANARVYGQELSIPQVFASEELALPPFFEPLIRALQRAERG